MEKILLNDLYPELDEGINGHFYAQETIYTAVIYFIENIWNGKAYIGKAKSYKKNGNRNGARARFLTHWRSRKVFNDKGCYDCPAFHEALNNSDLHDWFIVILKVCSWDKQKYWETQMIKIYKKSR